VGQSDDVGKKIFGTNYSECCVLIARVKGAKYFVSVSIPRTLDLYNPDTTGSNSMSDVAMIPFFERRYPKLSNFQLPPSLVLHRGLVAILWVFQNRE